MESVDFEMHKMYSECENPFLKSREDEDEKEDEDSDWDYG